MSKANKGKKVTPERIAQLKKSIQDVQSIGLSIHELEEADIKLAVYPKVIETLNEEAKKAKPFIEARKKPKKDSGTLKEFLNWMKGKEERIKKHKAGGRGWKKIIYLWMKDDGLAIEKTSAYEYLNKYF
jgi:hypothetical protein